MRTSCSTTSAERPEPPVKSARRFIVPGLFVLALGVTLFVRREAVDGQMALQVIHGPTMGTTYTVKIMANSFTDARRDALQRGVAAELLAVNAAMSTYIPDSELSRFNKAPANVPFEASAGLLEIFGLAEQISVASDGAFDITVGPLVNAYGFGPDGSEQRPDSDALAGLRARVGYRMIKRRTTALVKSRADVYCDLSAIAKGWGVDKVALYLEAQGIERYLVEVGGELRAKGDNASGVPWRVGIERPSDDGGRALQLALALGDRAMATSGDYRNFYRIDGRRVSHTIDPRSGAPVTHQLASVTVLHASAAVADGWATALTVLGHEAGLALADQRKLAAFFIVRQADGTYQTASTTAFENIVNAQ